MSRKFDIIKKKHLPDSAKILGFTFLKAPLEEGKSNKKYDFISVSNGNEIGCLSSKRSSIASTKGYIKVDNTSSEYIEVKTCLPLIFSIVAIFGIGLVATLSLGLLGGSSGGKQFVIGEAIGNFEISDKQYEKEEVKNNSLDDQTITFFGYGSYNVSAETPLVELKNPENNFVYMVFTLIDEATGELVARTGAVKPGEFVYVNVMDYFKETGIYRVLVNISTVDPISGLEMNGMNQAMEIVVS